jgi:predicted amidohydrolase YtcJ
MLVRIAVLSVAIVAMGNGQGAPDLILQNGKIITLDKRTPAAEAIAIIGDRIVALGSSADLSRSAGPNTHVLDLQGRLAIPGFIEGHAHFSGIGESRLSLSLREAKTWDDIVAQVARAAKQAKPGDWIVGRGWHQSKWVKPPDPQTEGFPVHAELSKAAPNNPVILRHASGHAAFVNAEAMRASGITRKTNDPAGGHIMRDASGNATGLLQEAAQNLAAKAYESWRSKRSAAAHRAEARKVIELATDECLSKGITSFQDAGSPFSLVDLLRGMADSKELRIRLWVMLRASPAEFAAKAKQYRMIGAGGNMLTVRAIKRSIDGALGSRGAWLLEPYSDLPKGASNASGLNTDDPAVIREIAKLAMEHDYQLCVHAIGDRANRETLDIFESTFGSRPGTRDLRWRIEHAQHINAADIPRFGKLGVIASMQGIHCTSDASYVVARLGAKRAEEGAYVWQKLMRTGAIIGNGRTPRLRTSALCCPFMRACRASQRMDRDSIRSSG